MDKDDGNTKMMTTPSKLLHQAEILFARKEYSNVSVREIAKVISTAPTLAPPRLFFYKRPQYWSAS